MSDITPTISRSRLADDLTGIEHLALIGTIPPKEHPPGYDLGEVLWQRGARPDTLITLVADTDDGEPSISITDMGTHREVEACIRFDGSPFAFVVGTFQPQAEVIAIVEDGCGGEGVWLFDDCHLMPQQTRDGYRILMGTVRDYREAMQSAAPGNRITDHIKADVWGLSPELAATWRRHFERVAPVMWDRLGMVFSTVDHAAKACPDMFYGLSWYPRAVACLEQARQRAGAAADRQAAKRKATAKAQRQARKRKP